jgi:hypothetical protein
LPINIKVLRGSIVPQAGGLSSVLKVPAEPFDQAFTFSGGFTSYGYDDVDLIWLPSEPVLNVGQGFFYTKASGNVSNLWIRNFTVQ